MATKTKTRLLSDYAKHRDVARLAREYLAAAYPSTHRLDKIMNILATHVSGMTMGDACLSKARPILARTDEGKVDHFEAYRFAPVCRKNHRLMPGAILISRTHTDGVVQFGTYKLDPDTLNKVDDRTLADRARATMLAAMRANRGQNYTEVLDALLGCIKESPDVRSYLHSRSQPPPPKRRKRPTLGIEYEAEDEDDE